MSQQAPRRVWKWMIIVLLGGGMFAVPKTYSQEANAQKKAEGQSKEEPKEPEAIDLDDASKEAAKPLPQVGYSKEEYEEFNKALTLPDLKSRAEGLANFIKTHPNSKLNEYASSQFAPIERQLYDQKDMANLATVAELYLQLKPDDVAALGYATEANYATKNYAKAAQYGEAFYKTKPSKELAQLLAFSFDQLKNEPKFVVYAEKCVADMPPKDGFFYAAKLSFYFAGQRNIPKAAAYCQKMMTTYGEGEIPPGYTTASWNQEKARSYAIIGRSLYDRKQYPAAVGAFNNSLKYFPQNDEAFYYIGMSYWFANDTYNAQKALAKAALLNKPYSKTARAQLESLFKQLHNGSLNGLDTVLRAASAEMK
ncbi:MAG: hypothetical protein U0V70_09665 [Terriglobia bacterium]